MLTDLPKDFLTLTLAEDKIFEARKVGMALCDMTEKQSSVAITGIIFKVSVICGCQLPTHDAHINALEQEFMLFLNDYGYYNLTIEEILTAFRMNANFQLENKIETYGTIFNIDFAGKVLTQYKDKRWALDRKIDNKKRERDQQVVLDAEEKVRREKIISQFNLFLSDENSTLDLDNCYMQLVHDGAFKDHNFYSKFISAAKSNERVNDCESIKDLLSSYGVKMEVTFEAERIAVKFLFRQMKITGKNKIYDENMKLIYPGFVVPEPEPVKDSWDV